MDPTCEQYCRIWRHFFSQVANWDDERIEEWIDMMKPKMQSAKSIVFHEEASTWAVWALLPHREGVTANRVERARNELIHVILSQRTKRGSEELLEWQSIRDAYRQIDSRLHDLDAKDAS